jgi:DNA topoisomerase-2
MTSTLRKPIDKFFDEEYLGYATYVVENRAIPSVVDGFKPTQRKVICAANRVWKTGNEKVLKVFQLAGTVAATMYYHHGDSSLSGAIIGMAQDFKNSMPLFHGEGQFGSLRSPEAGAPRYVGVKLNENFKLLYKDFDLLTSRFEEGEEIEPSYFLPIIPAVLLNGSSGIAVGFATNILNRHPLDLVEACMDVLTEKKKIREIKPWIKGFKGAFVKSTEGENSWLIRGVYEVKNTTTVEVTEIVPSYTFEDYDTHLTSLEEKGFITSYEDNRQGGNLSYTLKFTRAKLAELIEKNKLEDILKIQQKETENLTTLDEFGKLKIFKNSEEIVRYFVNFRLNYYQKRKEFMISELEREIPILSNRARFIKSIVENKIKVSKVKREEVILKLEELGFDKVDGSYNYLLNMAIYSLTLERYEELMKQVEMKKEELVATKKLEIVELYKKDLNDLKKKLEKDFKS